MENNMIVLYVCVHMYEHAFGGQRSTSNVVWELSTFLFERAPHWELRLAIGLGWPAREVQGSACLCLPITGLLDTCHGFHT